MTSCANWIKCAEFQNLLDVNNKPVTPEQIAKLCGECPRRVPVQPYFLPEPCPLCGDIHRGRCLNPPRFGI